MKTRLDEPEGRAPGGIILLAKCEDFVGERWNPAGPDAAARRHATFLDR
jgi:hypothetical protein